MAALRPGRTTACTRKRAPPFGAPKDGQERSRRPLTGSVYLAGFRENPGLP